MPRGLTPADAPGDRPARCPPGLAAELLQRRHQIVGQCPGVGVLVAAVAVIGRVQRIADLHADLAGPREPAADGIDLAGALHRHRVHGHAGAQRDAGQAGLAPVQATIGRAGAFRVHAQQVAALQHGNAGVEGVLGGVAGLAVDGHLARVGEEEFLDPPDQARGREVLLLRQEGHLAGNHQRKVERIHHGEMVRRHDRRTLLRHLLPAHVGGAVPHAQERADEHELEELVPGVIHGR